ncbi:ABC transporter permease [Piscinibacter sp. XHJ-5]|uniref:ABC transporter permease n=1 Tax=Piscinibacter sp. XHJ-5 TaxID=3037797 RepID=UPI0024528FDC|nr:ABC transporter permease [Piscinibacter sp. XHJ-5]
MTFAFFCAVAPRFASASNLENLMAGYAFIAIVAMGQAFAIIVRGIDLSVGAIVALAAMVALDASLLLQLPGWAVLLLAVTVATLAGAVNGLLVAGLGLQPFIATLATLAAYRGLVFAISGRQLMPELSTTPITDPWIIGLETFFDLGSALDLPGALSLPAIPMSFVVMLVLLVLFQTLLSRSRFGHELLAIGGNPEAARLAGIPVARGVVLAYTLSGLCAGIAALLLLARLTTATESLGNGLELTAIAGAVIGGVSVRGGSGSLWGPVLGTFLLGVVLLGLTLYGISQFVQQILTGAVLLAAVAHARWLVRRHAADHAT